mmetsp:Transcript_56547/g.155477  ORF Transcript_56547/g.155477 Transcript_56547/m.155477 type:complete len:248 (+) Transcript_56547:205-948(+)
MQRRRPRHVLSRHARRLAARSTSARQPTRAAQAPTVRQTTQTRRMAPDARPVGVPSSEDAHARPESPPSAVGWSTTHACASSEPALGSGGGSSDECGVAAASLPLACELGAAGRASVAADGGGSLAGGGGLGEGEASDGSSAKKLILIGAGAAGGAAEVRGAVDGSRSVARSLGSSVGGAAGVEGDGRGAARSPLGRVAREEGTPLGTVESAEGRAVGWPLLTVASGVEGAPRHGEVTWPEGGGSSR